MSTSVLTLGNNANIATKLVPMLGFQIHGLYKYFSLNENGCYDLKIEKMHNIPNFSYLNFYFKHIILLHLLNNLFKINGFHNPSSKFYGLHSNAVNANWPHMDKICRVMMVTKHDYLRIMAKKTFDRSN